jgi:hypothetical protein
MGNVTLLLSSNSDFTVLIYILVTNQQATLALEEGKRKKKQRSASLELVGGSESDLKLEY